MLTKEDLKQIGDVVESKIQPLRKELRDDFGFLASEISKLDTKIGGVEDRLGKKIDNVMTHVDGLAKNQKKFDEELVAHRGLHDRLGLVSSPNA